MPEQFRIQQSLHQRTTCQEWCNRRQRTWAAPNAQENQLIRNQQLTSKILCLVSDPMRTAPALANARINENLCGEGQTRPFKNTRRKQGTFDKNVFGQPEFINPHTWKLSNWNRADRVFWRRSIQGNANQSHKLGYSKFWHFEKQQKFAPALHMKQFRVSAIPYLYTLHTHDS